MNDNKSYAALLRELSNNYYNHVINYDDYRAQRREVLNEIDGHFNGSQTDNVQQELTEDKPHKRNSWRALGDTMLFSVQEIFKTQRKNI